MANMEEMFAVLDGFHELNQGHRRRFYEHNDPFDTFILIENIIIPSMFN
jgi:hypothetical protein